MQALRQCLGIDLGFDSVKIVELALDRHSVRAVRVATGKTGARPNMTPDEVRQRIIACAREVLKKGRFSVRKAVVSVSGQKVFIRRFRLPQTSEERLARIIQYEARQQIPFPLDRTYLQWNHRALPEEGEIEVLLVAMRLDEIKDFMAMVNRLGITPVSVGVSSFALFTANRFVAMQPGEVTALFDSLGPRRRKAKPTKPKKGASAPEANAEDEEQPADDFVFEEVKGYINIGATSFDLAIGKSSAGGGTIGFVRTVPIGGNEMNNAIMRNCGVEDFEDADRIKISSTRLASFALDMNEEESINEDASAAITDVADRIATELRRSLDFYITQPDGMAIDSLVLSGGQAQLPGIEQYLEEKLTMPVTRVVDPPDGSPLKWQEGFGPLTPYMIAIGLGLQGLGIADVRVDFLPEERKIIRDFPYKVTSVMLLILLGIVGVSSQAGKEYSQKYLENQQSLQQEILRGSRQLRAFEEAQKLHDEVADQIVNLTKSFGQRDYWMNFLTRLVETLPSDVMIENISLNHDGQVIIGGLSEVPVSSAVMAAELRNVFKDSLMAVAEGENNPSIERVEDVRQPPRYWNNPRPPSRFQISLKLKDKFNHLEVTPTPSPTPVGGTSGDFFGAGGFFGPGPGAGAGAGGLK
jgi:type IV pilus assembly protein PilM